MDNKENTPLLKVEGLKKYFPLNKDFFGRPQAWLRAVDDINFTLPAGKTIGVVGESGCGKTTLGRTILKLYEATDGRTIYYGKLLDEFAPKYYINDVNSFPSMMKKVEGLKVENTEESLKKAAEIVDNLSHVLGGLVLASNPDEVKHLLLEKVSAIKNNDTDSINNINAKLDEIKNSLKNLPDYNIYEDNYDYGIDLARITAKEMRPLRVDIQLIFQDPYSSLPPRMTVGSIISEAVKVHKIVPNDKVTEHVLTVMKNCGLQESYYDRYPHEFSGGQRQRICIARALAVNPKLVICDEPVSALDVSIQAQVINLLKNLQNRLGLTYIFISHDLSVVKYITDSIMVMYLGNVMEIGETDDIFDNPLHPYTQALFSAVPVPNPDAPKNRVILEGDIPSPANPPKGCKFHTRCSKCMEICKSVQPKIIDKGNNHIVCCHLYDDEALKQNEVLKAKALEEATNEEVVEAKE